MNRASASVTTPAGSGDDAVASVENLSVLSAASVAAMAEAKVQDVLLGSGRSSTITRMEISSWAK